MLNPVAHENAVLQIDDNIIAKCGHQVLALKNCTSTPGGTFCQLSPNSSCARELLAGCLASCQIQPIHLDPITWVDDGILIINNRPATVCIDNGTETWVHGTNLITFNKWAQKQDQISESQKCAEQVPRHCSISPSERHRSPGRTKFPLPSSFE